ncbi:twin-arginine translocase subunit TatC [Corynebacterium imitans]|uniref:twin-arginine translocase subunit TatC n=1 Tax=Corynebacterium imitans TaxID=156978 RepID=UPI00254C7B5E|nr:twin-arginine translocase subunit TatC [Corynebacterium imitans]MDK8306405.1 twin-arginine translocase subunit TatC [Corynebacterium imitans]MDK8637280.1 twin-arginine translocase subunit TatC [Corynebacterium imitans]MDK8772544.1 twin-arginine translocase subunit TatC [Corynebacterium imitans]
MSLVEHLQELRRRVMISLAAVFVGTIIGFIWYQTSPPGVMPLGEIIRGPYCNLPDELRADFSGDGQCRLLAISPFEMFMLRLKVGALAGLVLASPVWLTQIWNFITPGLHKNERRYTFSFVAVAVFLFVAGAVLAYFVLDQGLLVLMSIGTEYQVAALTGGEYYNFLLALIIIFGVSFEVPLILIMLNLVGILRYEHVKDKRRMIIVLIFCFAAVMTPGQDPFSMLALGISICLLVEMAFQFCRIHDKRTGANRPEWMDLDDEQASGPVTSSGAIGAATPVGPSAPVRPSNVGNAPQTTPPPKAQPRSFADKDPFDDVL